MDSDILDKKYVRLKKLLQLQNPYPKLEIWALIREISQVGEKGYYKLFNVLKQRYESTHIQINFIDGFIFEILRDCGYIKLIDLLNTNFPYGVVLLQSDVGIDYRPLQHLLVTKQFQKADETTSLVLCRLAQKTSQHNRSWLYFTDIAKLPSSDLYTIDQLWQVHSEGLFGLSIQRKIWLSHNSNWEMFWNKIGWKVNNTMCRYPQEFIWNITAPPGHLPLCNQLRGVQVLAALFHHPVWLK
uniref:GUN4-like domain-containing protein n=1 Tax=Dichotomaria marginata TaxID=268567 RepID=A0A1G4NS27_9FLOR|nr:Hypothetical protein ycf53 [Dichotomaria marginata]SCW21467.1 Hypothetical protein ycf53 [Dichotomaria marginata]